MKKKLLKERNNIKTILFISSHYNYFVANNSSHFRMYNNLKFFHENKNFNVVVLQPEIERKKESKELRQDIKVYYYKVLRCLGYTFQILNDFNPRFIIKIIKIIREHQIDLIHVDYVFGINILKLITKIPISYNAYNVEYLFANEVGKHHSKIPRLISNLYEKYIYFLEKRVVKIVRNINTISSNDKDQFIRIFRIPKDKAFVNDMGYIKEIYNNPIPQQEARERLGVDKNKFIVIYHGTYKSKSDNEAIEIIKNDIAPQVTDKDILFLLAGKGLPSFKNNDNLISLGFVNDVKEFLFSADIAIVPLLRGSGVRIKIIDYLSAQIPTITTKKGVEGLSFVNNKHGYVLNNSSEGFVEKIIQLKNSKEKIKEIKENLKVLLIEKYDWNVILKGLEKRYIEILKNNQ